MLALSVFHAVPSGGTGRMVRDQPRRESPSLAGWGLLVALRSCTAKARTVWTVVAAAAALLSLLGPLSATASAGTKASLVAMHLAVAAVLIVALRRATAER